METVQQTEVDMELDRLLGETDVDTASVGRDDLEDPDDTDGDDGDDTDDC